MECTTVHPTAFAISFSVSPFRPTLTLKVLFLWASVTAIFLIPESIYPTLDRSTIVHATRSSIEQYAMLVAVSYGMQGIMDKENLKSKYITACSAFAEENY